ncbi:MAG: protease modulator HflC [Comamonadaceae bacterium]|nr:protease modulator HflC [Comamonadaceae bacterium]
MNRIGFWVVSLLLLLAAASSVLFVVDERRYGVVYHLSEISRVVKQPGLHLKWLPAPFQTVDYLDKRLLTLESPSLEPTLTEEKQWVVIDWYVRWRITDPEAYIRSVGRTEEAGAAQLGRVVRSAFQEEVNRRTVRQLLSEDRRGLMQDVLRQVSESVGGSPIEGRKPATGAASAASEANGSAGAEQPAAQDGAQAKVELDEHGQARVKLSWGIEIVDVRITRVDYSKDITESVFKRMEAERTREANRLRSEGQAEGERIRANADRQRTETLATAYREAQEIRAQGDSAATETFARAYSQDPDFAQFYRSLQAYRSSLGKPGDVMVLDPNESEFFKAMRSPGAEGRRP